MGNILDLNHCILPQAPKASCWSDNAKRIKCIPKLIQGLNCFNIVKTEIKRQDKKKSKNTPNKQTKKPKSKISYGTQGKVLIVRSWECKKILHTSEIQWSEKRSPTPKAKKIVRIK